MSDYDQFWTVKWRRAGVPNDIVNKFYMRFGEPDEGLTEAICSDDGRLGLSWASIPYTNPEVRKHDFEMLLSKLGYRVTSNLEIQIDFIVSTLDRTAKAIIYAIFGIPIAIIGGGFGYFLGLFNQ